MHTFSFRPRFVSAACLASLGLAVVCLPSSTALAGPPPVTVVQPVQVEVVKSAPLAVTGTVAVSGPLNVTLAGNSSDTPVFVQTARQPLFRATVVLNWETHAGTSAKITNTTGARVAIQHIHTSGQISKAFVFKYVDVIIEAAAANFESARLKPTLDGSDDIPTFNQYSADIQVSLYLEPGESLFFGGWISGIDISSSASVTVSGVVLD